MPQPRDGVRGLSRPRHGGDVWGKGQVEDFSTNVNPLGPPPGTAELIAEAARYVTHYPDDTYSGLRSAISREFELEPSCIAVGAGSVELIRLVVLAYAREGDIALIPEPTFEEYEHACRVVGVRVARVRLSEECGFRLKLDDFFEALRRGVRIVFLCNPNNPTSTAERRERVLELAEECRRLGALLVVDEALMDLTPGHERYTCMHDAQSAEAVVVIRSLTKALAIPGLRVGYAVAQRDVARVIDAIRPSWSIGTIAQIVIPRLLKRYREHVESALRLIDRERRRVHRLISALSPRVEAALPDANFFFMKVSGLGITGREFRERLLGKGILVRDCSSMGEPGRWYVRFSLKTPEKNDILVRAIREAALGGAG